MTSARPLDCSFFTVRHAATIADATVADTLTVTTTVVAADATHLTINNLLVKGLQLGAGVVPTSAAALTVLPGSGGGSTLSVAAAAIAAAGTAVAGTLAPAAGITATATFPTAAVLTFTNGVLTDAATPAVSLASINISTTAVSPGSSDDQSFALPLVPFGTYNFVVAWGDGTSSTITTYNQPEATHRYAAAGTYTLQINGTLTGWAFNNQGDKQKVFNINSWGTMVLGAAGETGCFAGCSNLTITPTAGSPVTAATISLASCFSSCTSLNSTNVATWDVSAVQDISNMFSGCIAFNVNLSSWVTSSVRNMASVFSSCESFNNGDPVNGGAAAFAWNTDAVTSMDSMFLYCSAFNQTVTFTGAGPVGLSGMFQGCVLFNNGDTYNGGNFPLTLPNASSLVVMFRDCRAFNQTVRFGDISQINNLVRMFSGATLFNNGATADAGGIDMDFGGATSVLFADAMFSDCSSFNQTVLFGDTNSFTSIPQMFFGCSLFNNGDTLNVHSKPLAWSLSSIGDMSDMFNGCTAFNQPLYFSNMGSVINMAAMLSGCNLFKQDLSGWQVTSCGDLSLFYSGDMNYPRSALIQEKYDAMLISWSAQAVQSGVRLDMGSTKYSAGAAAAARGVLTNAYGWTINDGGEAPPPSLGILDINTANVSTGSSDDVSFALPLVATGGTYDFIVTWGDGTWSYITAYNQPEATHVYAAGGAYTLQINGTLTGWAFNDNGDKLKILNINSWGTMVLGAAGETGCFAGCSNLNIAAGAGSPVTAATTSLASCFSNCTSLNSTNLATWDVSAVQDISSMFSGCTAFNVNLSSWTTSSAQNMTNVFSGCTSFNNGDAGNGGAAAFTWNTAAVTSMGFLFANCSAFNQTVTFTAGGPGADLTSLFDGCSLFNNGDTYNGGNHALTLPAATSLQAVFRNCSMFNQTVILGDTSQVFDMTAMFFSAILFNNGAITNGGGRDLNFGATTNFRYGWSLFTNCTSFNQTVIFGDTTNVRSMPQMFMDCPLFNNGDIGNNGAKPLTWNLSHIQGMSNMFKGCASFNQALNFSNMGSSIIDLSSMLEGCTLFKQNLSAWSIASCRFMTAFYTGDINAPNSATSQDNYNALLLSWSAQPVQTGVRLDMGSSQYFVGVAGAARGVLTGTYGWTINDGGPATFTISD